MPIEESMKSQLSETAETLVRYGFAFWANKLNAIQQTSSEKSQHDVLLEIARLYGGFGTLMDLAVDPYLLPAGISEDAANKDLLRSINALYEYVKRSS